MRYIMLLTSILGLSVLPCFGQFSAMHSPMQLEKSAARAQKSLGELALVAQQIDTRSIGFDNQEQIRQAKVGTPVTDYLVRLDELQEYQAGSSAADLFHATGRLIYPLEVNQSAKSSVVLSFNQENWVVESFGAANQIRMVTELRRAIARTESRAEKELFQVRVPALQLMFVGVTRGTAIYLSPVFNMPGYGLTKGEKYPAEQVLEKLVDAARRHNGEPT